MRSNRSNERMMLSKILENILGEGYSKLICASLTNCRSPPLICSGNERYLDGNGEAEFVQAVRSQFVAWNDF
jgi:hypothetical protein